MARYKRKLGELNQEDAHHSKSKMPLVILVVFGVPFLLMTIMAGASFAHAVIWSDPLGTVNSAAILIFLGLVNIAILILAITMPLLRIGRAVEALTNRLSPLPPPECDESEVDMDVDEQEEPDTDPDD